MIQLIYTAVATVNFMNTRKSIAKKPHHLVFLLSSMWLLHAAQLTRMLWPTVGWVFDMVPLVGAGFMLAMTALVLTESKALRAYTQVIPAVSKGEALSQTYLDDFMRSEKPFLDPNLKLETLAKALNTTARHLSTQINRTTGRNFVEFVNRHRVAESQRLLCAEDEARTSVEAIGVMVGFRARSTFYESFRRVTGQTPAEYRRMHQS